MLDFPSKGCFFNICCLIWTSVLYWAWLGHMKPFLSKKQLRLEMFNELMILFLCYHLFCFTDLTDITA